ncbi:hypothetical protein Lalb_Chr21g0318601 [Lupinus albus]|uniref:Uncharacterized protein n=1 Tax=Lupinus albus TaxID=3870 RepID=A0A6A4NE95_LUPAL|nr:hypothetical protein Lalb_Chr21g0318601 [Lupinus albus]
MILSIKPLHAFLHLHKFCGHNMGTGKTGRAIHFVISTHNLKKRQGIWGDMTVLSKHGKTHYYKYDQG